MSRLPGTPPPSVYQVTHGTALQAAELCVPITWHTSSLVYQVTHGTALQAAERYVRQTSCGWYPTTGMTSICKAKGFISVYRLGEDGDLLKEGDGRLSVWALRARSYKTRAEA